jgi:Asp-tRNA(Asn)/Glu-tRNA(Gln) amidotransferase B subunit
MIDHQLESKIQLELYKKSQPIISTTTIKEYPRYWSERMSVLASAIYPLLKSKNNDEESNFNEFFAVRHDILAYVDACESAEVCNDLISRQACANRWLVGKRKVSEPFTRTRKTAATKKRKALENLPRELVDIVESVKQKPQYQQYLDGNEKILNSLVGMVLKQFKYDAAAVKSLFEK